METHLVKTPETEFPPSDSVDFQKTLVGSQPNSPPPSNPMKSSFDCSSSFDNLSPFRDETLDDQSGSAFLLDVDSQEEEEQPLRSSPVHGFSTYSSFSSHWAEPWNSSGDTKPSASNWSEPSSAIDTDSTALQCSEQWPSHSETETETKTMASVSFSPAWLNESNKPSMVGAGLANLGNTCFLNAVMQCFTHTVPLVQGLLSCNHTTPCDRNSEGFCVLCALRGHIELSLAYMGGVVSPLKLVDNLSYFSSSFRRFQQEDAHEFLQCLLDRLDSCCDDSKTKSTTLSSEHDNFVKQVFGGRLISKLRCCNCGHYSDTYEPSIDLSLEIEDVDSLPSALESFTKVEKIEDPEIKFTCENCKEEVSVEKQLMLDHAPSVAAFHLKRFKTDGSYVEKIDKHVDFPLELDLMPYTNGCQDNYAELKYDLYAIVVHIGFSSTSGHYYCFIRSSPDTWHRLDDSKVARVREDFVLSQEAYILFYAKQGTPWFSSFVETQKPLLDTNISNTSPKSVLDNVDNNCISSPSLVNSHSSEVNETRDASDGISAEFSHGPRNVVEVKKTVVDSHCDATVEKICTPLPLGERNCDQKYGDVKKKANVTPQTPPRSPSPDIYIEEPPEVSYSIPCGHLQQPNKSSCKRELNKELEDTKKKQACRLLKTMPGLRSSQLLEAMRGSKSEDSKNKKKTKIIESSPNSDHQRGFHSEGSMNKKRSRKTEFSSNGDDHHRSSARLKTNLSSMMRPVAAGNFR